MKNLLLLAPLLASIVAAQSYQELLQYGSGELPTCAETCTTLLTADDGCKPPASADQNTYFSCFCQSGFLSTLRADASTICDTTCTSQTDRTQIQSWYIALCNAGPSAVTAAVTSVAAASTTVPTGATTTTGISAATETLSSSQAGATNNNTQSSGVAWWHAHARWIAMAIVLIVAFTLIGLIGMWLKRRSTRRHQRAAALAPPVVWGPHQNQHYTGGTGYGGRGGQVASGGKGKGNAALAPVLPTSNNQPVDYSEKDGVARKKKGGKLRKLMGR